MKLSEQDRENIEVLEATNISEKRLFKLLSRYFALRETDRGPDQALQETIHWGMELVREEKPHAFKRR